MPQTDDAREDDCPYCGGSEEVEARLYDGTSDYIPCPDPRHRLATPATTETAASGEVERDAARWRALWSSDRIRMMGTAGFDTTEDGAISLREGPGWHHLGMEVWDMHPAKGDASDEHGRRVLLAYVNHRAALAPQRAVGREEIARVIYPDAWRSYDATLRPFQEARGAREGESWHVRAYQSGCRDANDAKRWWHETADGAEPIEVQLFRNSLTKADAILALLNPPAVEARFALGQRVRKVTGSSWHGTIVGRYATSLTKEGYAVESDREPGPVQIYPAAALEAVEGRAKGDGA